MTNEGSETPANSGAAYSVIVSSTPKGAGVSSRAMRVRYRNHEELIIFKEVVAAKAHVARYGSVVKQFEMATNAINKNPQFRTKMKTRNGQEKFNKMVKEFRSRDKSEQAASGLGGEQSLMGEMMSSIFKEVEGEEEAEKKVKEEVDRAEARKRAARARVLAGATGHSSGTDCDDRDTEDEKYSSPRGLKRHRIAPKGEPRIKDGPAAFGASLREAELAKVAYERKKLEFEQQRHADLMRECEAERMAEAAENERKERADMARLQAMLDFVKSSTGK